MALGFWGLGVLEFWALALGFGFWPGGYPLAPKSIHAPERCSLLRLQPHSPGIVCRTPYVLY